MDVVSEAIANQIVSLYYSDPPMSQREIARKLGISRNAVQYWIEKRKNNESGPLRSKMGRPRKQPPSKEVVREANLQIKRLKREDPVFRAQEVAAFKKARKRKNISLSNVQESVSDVKRQKTDFDLNWSCEQPGFQKLQGRFLTAVADGPRHPCYCCDRLWFKKGLRPLTKSLLFSKGSTEEFVRLTYYKDIGDTGYFCQTCYNCMLKLKIPQYAISNGFEFPEIPDCLRNLNPLEERLVSPRIPFMQIYAVHGCQFKIKGSVVNVPIQLDSTVNKVPRNLDDSYTVHIKLKKKLTMKSDYMYEIVCPHKVHQAAEYLLQQELYQSFEIALSENWMKAFEEKKFDMDKLILEFEEDEDDEENNHSEVNFSDTQTMITSDRGICLAPGENKIPLSLLYDACAEELSFPTIYCGKVRYIKTNPIYTTIANSEIRRSDRRAARPDHLLYAYSKYIHLRLVNAFQIAIRGRKLLGQPLTAGHLLDEDCVNQLVEYNYGYKFLKNIKNAPAHWENEKKRVYAGMRQWGMPTLFLTMSVAEPHWFELMQTLSLNVDNHVLSREEFEDKNKFSDEKKHKLIQKDPVTCALYFDYRFRELLKIWKEKHGAFEKYKIKYSYHRIEFQHRGSPHVHMLLWLENAPIYGKDSVESCEKFVEEMMTCSINNQFIDYQKHRHTSTCYKKKGKSEGCRFEIPYFPMDKTRILDPFNDNDPRCKNLKPEYHSLYDYLATLDWKNNKQTFEEFLSSLNLTLDRYILILKSGINRTTVFLKREVNEIMVNNYNPKILNLMRSNMDIQFITNGYACAAYVVDYINKSQRGMSKLLKKCISECNKRGDVGLRGLLRKIMNTYLNSSEVSAQEAAWSLLELPMSKLSVADIFIPTFQPKDRVRMVKDAEKLKGLPRDSTDVCEWSIFDKYIKRPTAFENLCLADFATGYEFVKNGKLDMKLMDRNLFMKERKKDRKVLRCVNYKRPVDPEQFYREQLTLYMPWRDEIEDILSKNLEFLYNKNNSMIELNKRKYHNLDLDVEQLEEKFEDEDEIEDETENENFLKNNIPKEFEDDFSVDIQRDLDQSVGKEFGTFKITSRWEDSVYRSNIRKANERQFDILKHIMYLEFTNSEPYSIFITGPAGCGKSYLISILEQTLIRMYEKAGDDPSLLTVLKVAPTGKAAYNIKGLTLHAAFALPTKMKQTVLDLSPSTLNDYRATYKSLKNIIIDEISMVSYSMFRCVDQRMQQIMGNDKPFGNLNVLCFGDFRQLPPVAGTPVYVIPQTYGMDQLAGNRLWERFQLYELTEIMRQKEDMAFAQCLNHVADGTMTPQDIALIESRIVKNPATISSSPIHLFHRNADVDGYNALEISQMNTEGYIVEAHDSVTGRGSSLSKKAMAQKVKSMKRMDTANLSSKITLKLEAKYMLVYNLDTMDGLVNGAMGVLRKIEWGQIKNKKNLAIKTLWMEFEDEEIGKNLRRAKIQYMIQNRINTRWTPIMRLRKIIYSTRNCPLSVCREQFPVVLSEALTIHKSQGATYKECAAHVEKKMKRSLMYVQLSRATRADGLYVIGEFEPPKPPPKNDRQTAELARLRLSPLKPIYQFLHNRGDFAGIQFMYHNVQGLKSHHEDVLADPCFRQSDLILLVETHTIPSDDFKIPGFEIAGAIDSNGRTLMRKNRGVMTYIKKDLIDRNKKNVAVECDDIQILISYILNNVRFAVCYANPRASTEDILFKIVDIMTYDEDRKTVLVGDFNIDFNSQKGQDFIEAMRVVGLELRTNPKHYTTRGHTTIDAIFSNKGMRTGVYMTTYNYHMALYGRID